MRPQLEHGMICRLIRIYNRCRLFNAVDSADKEIDDAYRSLYDLHKKYVEELLETDGDGGSPVSCDNSTLFPGPTQNELYKLLVVVIESHRSNHIECDITPSLLKETSDSHIGSPFVC